MPRHCPPAFPRCKFPISGTRPPKSKSFRAVRWLLPDLGPRPPVTASLWLPGPGKAVSREVSTYLKICCLMQDVPTLSLSPRQPGHLLPGAVDAVGAPRGCKRCLKRGKGKMRFLPGLHFSCCKSSTRSLFRRARPNLQGYCGAGAWDNGGPGPHTPLSVTCWPHPTPPASGCPPLPDSGSTASLFPKERRFKGQQQVLLPQIFFPGQQKGGFAV